MTTRTHHIEVGGIPVEVVRKEIKNLHLAVYPPSGRVRVAVPPHVDDEAVRLAVISRIGWIRRQQQSFEQQERQSARELVSGETHYVWGRRYRLDVVTTNGRPCVRIRDSRTLELRVAADAMPADRGAALQRWYRRQLRAQAAALIEKWSPIIGAAPVAWGIKKMKTRWGTCNTDAQRIWVNLELAKKPPECLEYIVVHELIHLLERHHNDRFRDLMDVRMPQWRVHRDTLNSAPLSHESWVY